MAAVDSRQAIKQGDKGCFNLLVASKTYDYILKVSLCPFSSCLVDTSILWHIGEFYSLLAVVDWSVTGLWL